MFVKICGTLDNAPDITTIECDQYRIRKDSGREDKREDVMLLTIKPVNKRDDSEGIVWLLSEDKSVWLLNDEGKTVDKIY